MKGRIKRLERVTGQDRLTAELAAIFLNGMQNLQAQIDGEELPALHPRASDPEFAGTFLGEHSIVGGEAVEDLSE